MTLGLSIVLLPGCATMVNGTRQKIMVNSSPDEADVLLQGQQVGRTPWMGSVPRASELQLTLAKPGYKDQPLALSSTTSGWLSVNVFSGLACPLGSTTDLSSGGAYEYQPGSYHVTLVSSGDATRSAPTAATPITPPVVQPEAARPAPSDSHVQAGPPPKTVAVVPPQRQDALIKRFVLTHFKDIGYDLASGAGERLETLKVMMGYNAEPTAAFATMLRPFFTNAKSADDLAERLIRVARATK